MTDLGPQQHFTSPLAPGRVLHVIVRAADITDHRVNVTSPDEWLQLSLIPLQDDSAMRPHTHDPRSIQGASPAPITQEAWVVLRGEIHVRLYDEDRTRLAQTTLGTGDLLVTFYGGHAFDRPSPGTLLLECKNGPYKGRDYTPFEDPGDE